MPTRAIKAIFFSRFHPARGSHVLHQVPEGSITPSTSTSALSSPLFDFDSVTSYVIPNQQFCDRLITFCANHHRIIGYPVCIREGTYSRNEFIFNFAIVLEESAGDWAPYGEVVRKMGRLLRGLEEQGGFLSKEEGVGVQDEGGAASPLGGEQGGVTGSKVYALCEMVLEDLNNYAECMIPIDESNTINLKLFPTHPPPPSIHAHQVPLLTISLSSLTAPISSDLTLTRVLPYIDGVNSVAHISQLADTDLSLTKKAIQHLIYYGCLVLLDIFSFGAIYAPTAEIGGFISEQSVQEECARYVKVPKLRMGSASKSKMGSESEIRSRDERSSLSSEAGRSDISTTLNATGFDTVSASASVSAAQPETTPEEEWSIPAMDLIMLYTSLRQGLTLKDWVLENLQMLKGIDIRRFITFGVIKGFLYRVHRYAISTSTVSKSLSIPPAPPASLQSLSEKHHYHDPESATAFYGPSNPNPNHRPSMANANANGEKGNLEDITRLGSILSTDRERAQALPLVKFLDGMHCFDEICLEVGLSEKKVEEKIKGAGDVVFFYK